MKNSFKSIQSVLAGIFFAVLLCVSFASPVVAQDGSEAPVADLTGSWFSPEFAGWGFAIDHAPEAIVFYWYDYEDVFIADSNSDQMWLVGSSDVWPLPENGYIEMYRPEGLGFQLGNAGDSGEPVAIIRQTPISPVDGNTLFLDYRLVNFGVCQPVVVSPSYPLCGGTMELTRLTRRVEVE